MLAGPVADGLVSLTYRSMNSLDEASTTNYSTRAAAASGCAAGRDGFVQYAHALFVNQPSEGGRGRATLNWLASAVPPGCPAQRPRSACPMRLTWTGHRT